MQTINSKLKTINYDSIIEKGIVFLLIFTPLAIGTVQDWSAAIMEIVSFLIFAAWLLKNLTCESSAKDFPDQAVESANKKLFISFSLILCIIVFQILPLPSQILSVLSPKNSFLYQTLIDDQAWRTISICPNATFDQMMKVMSYAAVFFVIIHHYNNEEKMKGLFRALIYIGCSLAFLAVVQKVAGNGKILWLVKIQPDWKPFGPYINKNHFAGYMEMTAPIALSYCLYLLSKVKKATDAQGSSKVKTLLMYLDNKKISSVSLAMTGVLIITGALFMTFSRGAIIGYILSMMLFILLSRSRRSLRKKTGFLVLIGAIVGLAAIASGWSMLQERFELAAQHGTTRIDTWHDSISLLKDYSFVGTGFGTFDRIYPLYQSKYPHLYFEHPENEYLEILVETGIVGFAAFWGLVIVYFSSVLKRWRERHNAFVVAITVGGISSCAAIMIHGLTDFNMRIPANAMLLTVIAAATYAAVFKVHNVRNNADERI